MREQIKDLVQLITDRGIDKEVLGFSNSRMAYDDVFSRAALAIERKSIGGKITAANLTDLYRQEEPLTSSTVELMSWALSLFSTAKQTLSSSPRFNKATLFSWLIFVVRMKLNGQGIDSTQFALFLEFFRSTRGKTFHDRSPRTLIGDRVPATFLFAVYESRSSARVADVSSVLLRDAVVWLVYETFIANQQLPAIVDLIGLPRLHAAFDEGPDQDDLIAKRLIDHGWGKLA